MIASPTGKIDISTPWMSNMKQEWPILHEHLSSPRVCLWVHVPYGVMLFCLVCHCSVSCVPNVAFVSGLSVLDWSLTFVYKRQRLVSYVDIHHTVIRSRLGWSNLMYMFPFNLAWCLVLYKLLLFFVLFYIYGPYCCFIYELTLSFTQYELCNSICIVCDTHIL